MKDMASQRGRSKQMAVETQALKRRATQRARSVSRVRPAPVLTEIYLKKY